MVQDDLKAGPAAEWIRRRTRRGTGTRRNKHGGQTIDGLVRLGVVSPCAGGRRGERERRAEGGGPARRLEIEGVLT